MFKKKLVLLCLTKESSEKQSQIAGINVTYASKEKEGPEYEVFAFAIFAISNLFILISAANW